MHSLGTLISQLEPLPKAQSGTFTVAIAELDNDPDGKYQILITEDLQSITWINTLKLSRAISVDPNRFRDPKHRYDIAKAHILLKQTGAQILLWGSVLRTDQSSVPDLLMTSDESGQAVEGRFIFVRDLNLPEVFWDQLADLLYVEVMGRFWASAGQHGLREADIQSLQARLQRLLRDTKDQPGWNVETRENVQLTIAQMYRLLVFVTNKAEYYKDDLAICNTLLSSDKTSHFDARWLAILEEKALAQTGLAEHGDNQAKQELLNAAVSNFRLLYSSFDEVVNNELKRRRPLPDVDVHTGVTSHKADIQKYLGEALEQLEMLQHDNPLLHQSAIAYKQAAELSYKANDAFEYAYVMLDLGKVLLKLDIQLPAGGYLALAERAFRNSAAVFERLRTDNDVPAISLERDAEQELAHTLLKLGRQDMSSKGSADLKEALAISHGVLLREAKDGTADWGIYAQIADVFSAIAARDTGPTKGLHLREAIEYYRFALNPYDSVNKPEEWFYAQNNMATVVRDLGESRKDGLLLCEATVRSVIAEHGLAARNVVDLPTISGVEQNAAESIEKLKGTTGNEGYHECLGVIAQIVRVKRIQDIGERQCCANSARAPARLPAAADHPRLVGFQRGHPVAGLERIERDKRSRTARDQAVETGQQRCGR